jgi:hypothetical protein
MFFFAGPLFYIGLWMTVDPTGFARLASLLIRVFNDSVRRLGVPEIRQAERAGISRKLRTGVRCAGLVLVLFRNCDLTSAW